MALVQSDFDKHLTQTDPEFEAMRRRTYPGMAHFAGTGPKGTTCRQCKHWDGAGEQTGYFSKTGKNGGVIKPRSCSKHRELMRGQTGPAIPHNAASCKHYEEAAEIPPVEKKSF